MKLIIAGTRTLKFGIEVIAKAVQTHNLTPTQVVSGRAPGVDTIGEDWANFNDINVKPFPAKWTDLSHPDALIRERNDGTLYDAKAGTRRNKEMAEYGDALLLIWDGKSKGSRDMKLQMRKLKKPIFEVLVK